MGPMVPEKAVPGLEAVPDDQTGRLRPQTRSVGAGHQADAEAATFVGRVPLVEDRLADDVSSRQFDHGKVQPVILLPTTVVPGTYEPLIGGAVVMTAGQP
jgi:hypothetical protein